MSTADSAGRPLRPTGRGPVDGGRSGASRGSGPQTATRTADAQPREGQRPAGREATRPVARGAETAPVRRPESAPARPAGAAAGAPRPQAPKAGAPRRVRLVVSRVDPWSAMKVSFLLSVALGIALVVMTVVLWTVLDAMGVFDQVNGVVGSVIQDGGEGFDILDFVGFTRVVSLSIVIGVIDVILFTAIATLSAFLYNVSSALVGGLHLTLTDD